MTYKVTRALIALVIGLLLASTTSLVAQDKAATLTKEEKKKEEQRLKEEKKAAEEKKKQEAKAAKDKPKAKQKDNADIDNIGNRNINPKGLGGGAFVPSMEEEIAIGKQVSKELEASVNLVRDKTITEYVNRVGQNIVRNSDAKVPFTIKVIESDEINAVSLPGGFFYVNTGLILAADEEAELAGVMAHEIAHVAARHAAEQQGKATWVNLASMPAMIFGGGIPGMIIQQAASIGVPIGFMHFSRSNEEEADWLGLQYLYKSGYDPGASVSFFEKLQARESAKKKMSSLFASHPPTEARVKETKENIEQFLPARERYLVTTSEFQKVKGLLAELQAQQSPNEKERAPSLRTRTSGRQPREDGEETGTGTSRGRTRPEDREPDADAPPVLKRPQEKPQ